MIVPLFSQCITIHGPLGWCAGCESISPCAQLSVARAEIDRLKADNLRYATELGAACAREKQLIVERDQARETRRSIAQELERIKVMITHDCPRDIDCTAAWELHEAREALAKSEASATVMRRVLLGMRPDDDEHGTVDDGERLVSCGSSSAAWRGPGCRCGYDGTRATIDASVASDAGVKMLDALLVAEKGLAAPTKRGAIVHEDDRKLMDDALAAVRAVLR